MNDNEVFISDCCGAVVTLDMIDYKMCPDCKEHCEIISEDEED